MTQVTASQVQINLPHATARPERRGLSKGAVGDFVFIDCERVKLLGRIVETRLPDVERLTVEPQLGTVPEPNPVGRVQLLAGVEQGASRLQRGLPLFPRIGDGVYLSEPRLLADLIRHAVAKPGERTLSIGTMNAADGVDICLPPEKIFGRHCGIFGATGGGKSWTLATLIYQLKKAGGKALILDPTGEFTEIGELDNVFVFEAGSDGQKQVHFPYRQITEDDLFTLFRPSGLIQGPKLREAIKSLKLVHALHGQIPPGLHVNNGIIEKLNRPRAAYSNAVAAHAALVHSANCNFDIRNLPEQIKNECVHASGAPGNFGNSDQAATGWCEALISRINALIHSKELECIFRTAGSSLVEELTEFFQDDTRDLALISFREVRFEHNTREILLNIIGRFLLSMARAGTFRDRPLVVFLDEAHQFLGKTVGDEYASVRLDSFGLIAKEGRKYGLSCVLATQRPRDVPQDVLSQLGTLFVHRLMHDQDRETVERACGDLDRGAAQFIPMLAPGEAIVIGPDLPAPLPLFIHAPPSPPDSKGPQFQEYWTRRQLEAASVPAQNAADVPTAIVEVAEVSASASVETGFDDEIPF